MMVGSLPAGPMLLLRMRLKRLVSRVAGNLATTSLVFAPLVVAVGLMTNRPPGSGLSARGGIEASLPTVRDLRPTI